MISMCCFSSSIVMPELAGDLGDLMVLQQPQVLGDDLLGRRAVEPEMPQLQQQALLQVARGDADRVEASAPCCSARSTSATGHGAHRRELVDRRHQIAVVVEVADDRLADLAISASSVCIDSCQSRWSDERAAGRQRVLDRRQLLDLRRRPRPVAVVEVVAEEVLVVLVVPGVGLLRPLACRLPAFPACCCSAGCSSSVGTSSSSGFSTISWFSRSDSSSVDIGSSLIACCSDGVRMSF